MSQFDFGTIDPDTKDGTTLAGDLGSWRDALNTLHRGTTRPSYAQAGMAWIREVSGTLWELSVFDGTTDIVIANINPSTNIFSLPNDSVGNAAMQANAVNTGNIVDLAVTGAKIADGQVNNPKLANDAVSALKIANGAVTRLKINGAAYASTAEVRQASEPFVPVSPTGLSSAQVSVGRPNGPYVTIDMHAGVNFTCGQSQHFAVTNPINEVAGRVGLLLFWNAGGGPHTISWGSQVVSMSGSLPDVLEGGLLVPYYCEYVGRVWLP
ncbi:MAG: hypothetical protein AAGG65_17645 [Pseudomonadota bacterium]